MFNSMDTNIIIGILNPRDRLHKKSLKLIEEKNNWVIPGSIIVEIKRVLRRKINYVILKIMPKIIELSNFSDLIEIKTNLLSFFTDAINKDPSRANFYKLVYAKIDAYISRKRVIDPELFSFLSTLGDNMARVIEPELGKYIRYKKLKIDLRKEEQRELLKEIKKILIAKIIFKDPDDENIFFELMIHLKRYKPLTFFTDDNEFIETGNKSFDLLVRELNFEKKWFTIKKDC